MSKWFFDLARTQARHAALRDFYVRAGLNADRFACPHAAACHGSQKPGVVQQYAGGTAGLNPLYDVTYDGQPIRVLIIGKEASHRPHFAHGTPANFDERSRQCLETITASRRTFHIKGTLLTLQRIFEVQSDYVYASYALSNALRCAFQQAAIAHNTCGTRDTATMRRNCIPYLLDEIALLEPTLIITQGAWAVDGKRPFVAQVSEACGAPARPIMHNGSEKYGLFEFPGFMLITSHHPARLNWWKERYAPDSLWPMLDHLKAIGYLPRIAPEDAAAYESLARPHVDRLLSA